MLTRFQNSLSSGLCVLAFFSVVSPLICSLRLLSLFFAALSLFAALLKSFTKFQAMSAAMDKALMAMSLEDEDVPFEMPDLPQFSSCEKNVLSLIGRFLNPKCQSMSSLIYDMPRKWQKVGRVRGVALSDEKFQFIFSYEHDLIEVLEKGFQTYNEWGLVLERWSLVPPPDSLQFVEIWVQIKNIPLNYYTELSISALGDLVGQVKEVIFDPDKPQSKDYVRVLVKFDVSRPLKKSKVVNLPKGLTSMVYYFYEKVQKRCYRCQRLTHEQDDCPLVVKQFQDQVIDRKLGRKVEKPKAPLVLKENDPLFGVLKEEQVGIHPLLGRPRIAPDVLEGMRQYLKIATGEERKLREEKVKKSVADAENDPIAQKLVLRLEPLPIISKDMEKGKGIVFGYDSSEASSNLSPSASGNQLPLKTFSRAEVMVPGSVDMTSAAVLSPLVDYSQTSSFSVPCSSAYVVGLLEAGPSGTKPKKSKGRRRPYATKRKQKAAAKAGDLEAVSKKEGLHEGILDKRKGIIGEDSEDCQKVARRKTQEVVPNEGLSNI